jgi:hypothetical protein
MQHESAYHWYMKRATESTAYHEAGRVVAAYFLRIPFGKIAATIGADEAGESSGSFVNRLMLTVGELEWKSDRTRLKAERLAQVCLAGMVAQRRYRPSSVPSWHSRTDNEMAHVLVSAISGSQEEVKAHLNLIMVRAQMMFADPHRWKCVTAIADALVEKKTLSREDAVTLIQASRIELPNVADRLT